LERPLPLNTLNVANVPRALLLEEDSPSFFGLKALATTKVLRGSPFNKPPPLELRPEEPAPNANRVLVVLWPIELINRASVVDTPLLLSIATAAKGFTFPLATPDKSTAFLRPSLLLLPR
jgi:hypothetical protein